MIAVIVQCALHRSVAVSCSTVPHAQTWLLPARWLRVPTAQLRRPRPGTIDDDCSCYVLCNTPLHTQSGLPLDKFVPKHKTEHARSQLGGGGRGAVLLVEVDEAVGGAVVRLDRLVAAQLRQDRLLRKRSVQRSNPKSRRCLAGPIWHLCQLLAELDAPLVERVDVPHNACNQTAATAWSRSKTAAAQWETWAHPGRRSCARRGRAGRPAWPGSASGT